MRRIEDFVGSVLISTNKEEDYVQLFSDLGVINLYNRLITPLPDLTDTAGNVAIDRITIREGELLIIRLSDGREVCMSLADTDYSGPEAALFSFADGEMIVIS